MALPYKAIGVNGMGLREHARSGVMWTGLAVAASAAVQVIRIVILARFFLEPHDFGLIALAIAVIYIIAGVADFGTTSSLLHRQDATRAELSSVFWFNVVLGFAFCALTVLAAPLLGRLLHEPAVTPLLQALAVCLVIDGCTAPLLVLLRRDLQFRRASLAEAISILAGTAVTLVLAVFGLGVWALAIGMIAQTLLRAILVLRWGWSNFALGVRLKPADLKGFLAFGAFQTAERLVGRVSDRIGQLLLDAIAGPVQLGLYSVASNLATMPMLQILPIIGLTATPILSKTQSDAQRMARGYFLATEILMTVMAPMFLGLLVIAPTLVPLLLGDKWTESAPIFQVVCLNTLFYSFYFFSGALIIAKGRGLLGFGWRVGLLLATIAPAYLGAYYGKALGLASGIAAVTALAIVPYYLFVLRRLLGPCLGALARAIGIPVAMGAVMATVVAMLGSTLQGWNSVAALTIEIATGVLLYAALLLLFRPGIAREIMLVVPFGRIFGLLGSMRGAWLGRSS